MQPTELVSAPDCPDRITEATDVEAYVSDILDPIVGVDDYTVAATLTRGGALLVRITPSTELGRARAIGKEGSVADAIRRLLRSAVVCRHIEVEVTR